jgi:fructokinase
MLYPEVLCLGEILVDRLSDQPGRDLAQVESWTDYAGGAPANVATALVKLGTSAGFIGAIGNDLRGNDLVALLTQLKINITGVQRLNASTRSVLVVRSATGDRTFAAFGDGIDTTDFADTKLNAALLPQELFEQAKYLVLGTLEMAYDASRSATEQAIFLAKRSGMQIVLDVNWRPVFWPDKTIAPALIKTLIAAVDYLKLADEESRWLFQTTDPQVIAAQFPNLSAVLVTAGEQGCDYWIMGNTSHVSAFNHLTVVDTTGAGDSFLAGFIAQMSRLDRATLQEAQVADRVVRYASAVGALTTTQAGAIAAQPNVSQVTDFLSILG